MKPARGTRTTLPFLFLTEKKTKIVLSLRNPKDVFVSFYHHHKGLKFFEYDGKFEDYLPIIVAGECKIQFIFLLIVSQTLRFLKSLRTIDIKGTKRSLKPLRKCFLSLSKKLSNLTRNTLFC